ncbi:rod-binding protein [Bdellovibrio sp. SKB1291214]|uniref:rod-binding protein n=1 Tax=Bdellovibrio sp. SKB1291214 TaxID=1732569 RepID=UPI002240CC22|nr:rod-binding protein [Bdellovibrio sp. SKB1291214]UYL10114.1 rod-binding protein [Bdellovibrio sp. SKB1291214]
MNSIFSTLSTALRNLIKAPLGASRQSSLLDSDGEENKMGRRPNGDFAGSVALSSFGDGFEVPVASGSHVLPFVPVKYVSLIALVFVASFAAQTRAEIMDVPLEVNPAVQAQMDAAKKAQEEKEAAAKAAASQGASQAGTVDPNAPSVDRSKFKNLPSRFMGRPQQKSADEKLKDVSKMYEKHFLGEMMKAMRSTVHESGFIQVNQAEKIFREQLDGEYVDKWSEKGGIGLSKVIYDQLIDKYGAQLGIKKTELKPMGPIALNEKSNFTAHQFRHPGRNQDSMSYRISRTTPPPVAGAQAVQASENQVKAPWGGTLRTVRNLVDKQTMLEIEHDNGLKSQVVFKGELSQIETGKKVQAGETLGILSPEAKSLYWTVEPDHQTGKETVSE